MEEFKQGYWKRSPIDVAPFLKAEVEFSKENPGFYLPKRPMSPNFSSSFLLKRIGWKVSVLIAVIKSSKERIDNGETVQIDDIIRLFYRWKDYVRIDERDENQDFRISQVKPKKDSHLLIKNRGTLKDVKKILHRINSLKDS
jgi:hypothetical protein